MNSLIKKILFLILISFLMIRIFPQDCKATLIIETDREDAVIYLDNDLIGKGRIVKELDAGLYNVVVKESNNVWDENILSRSIKLNQCNHQTLFFSFDEGIYFRTAPQDAAVYSNDSLIGYTPLYLSNNFSNLQLRKTGYENKFISLDDYNKDYPVTLNYIGKIEETSFYEKDLFKILLAGIVVLGGTTAYFKLKADEKFEAYELTGDKELLNQTEKYDLISGITFTALQINFGALIYFFLDD